MQEKIECIRCGKLMVKNKCEDYCLTCGYKIDCSDHVGLKDEHYKK